MAILRTRGVELYYEDNGQGVPLLCLHAFPADSTLFRYQDALSDTARVITPDLRGQGQSSVTPGPYTMELLADDMFALLDQCGIERAVVLGVSLGGYVALAMYAAQPGRVRGLVLCDTRAEADSPEARVRRESAIAAVRQHGAAAMLDAVPQLFGVTTRQQRPKLVEEQQQRVAQADPEGLAFMQQGLMLRPDRQELLGQIRVPTVVLCGEEDTLSTPEQMRAMANRIPGARFYPIPLAGHLAPLEHPGAVNRVVREFLTGLEPGTP